MDLSQPCSVVKQKIVANTKRSIPVKIRVSPVMRQRLKDTSRQLHISQNELVNFVLDEVLP